MGPPHFLQLIANDLPGLAVDVAFSGAGPFRDLGLRPWDDVAECQQAGRLSARRVGSTLIFPAIHRSGSPESTSPAHREISAKPWAPKR
jgi:hypothetical protein